ncbi:MAG TPA: BT4734/BF3469 family protein [Aequorivita sp.]|nr:BT4734/BF3469 family protein [Aequorivita sp.]
MREPFKAKALIFNGSDKIKETAFTLSSGDVIRRMKKGYPTLIKMIDRIRTVGISEDERNKALDSLHVVDFNEELRVKNENGNTGLTELFVFDFGGFPDSTTMIETKSHISQKPYVFMCFDSEDGKSLKTVIRTPAREKFKDAELFKVLKEDFNSKYLDTSKISKSFRESYDPDIHINNYCEELVIGSNDNPIQEQPAKKEKEISVVEFVANWKKEFIARIKEGVKSKKQNFHFGDALKRSEGLRTGFDTVMIEYWRFLKTNPLQNNDYFKYVDSYRKDKKLNEKYFRYDLSKLKKYYDKVDKAKKEEAKYNPFNEGLFNKYTLFMMLKLRGEYRSNFNEIFGIKFDKNREYNPLTSIPSVLRSVLPFKIKEYDISRAYPTFIFMELGMKPFDVYERIDKRLFNTLLNMHSGVENATIEGVRDQLRCVYGDRVDEVITEERFNKKGRLFEELSKYEAEYIEKFVTANDLKNYVRLHDGIIVGIKEKCKVLEFGDVIFKEKEITTPEEREIVNFYEFDEEGKVITSPVLYSNFFEQENLLRVTREGHDKLTILKNESKIVTPINHKTDLVPFLKANINEFDTSQVENRIARDATNVIQQALQLLIPIPLEYHRDTKTQCDIPFKNGVARITAKGMELVSYDNIDGFFAKHSTQEHDISFIDVDAYPSDFAHFLMMAATGKDVTKEQLTDADETAIMAFCSMFGYLISNYKNPAFNPAIILSDDDADGETRNGGRGKTLVQVGLSHFRPSIEKGGNAYDPNYTHVHADLKQEHDLYLLDDVPSNFDYNALYTHITGSIDAQRKGVTAETIPFEYAPKFVISTNWAVRYDAEATSTNRRFKEYKFSKFWNINNTPDAYFGKSFFNDWDEEEWNAFYNFGLFCVQHYLIFGLQSIEYDKEADNFRAYFYNDSILEETERIFKCLEGEDSFTVTDFIRIHRASETYMYKPEFTIRNAKKYIDAYNSFQEKPPYLYSQRVRKWEKVKF